MTIRDEQLSHRSGVGRHASSQPSSLALRFALVALCGCRPEPPAGVFDCADNTECPKPLVCDGRSLLCVRDGGAQPSVDQAPDASPVPPRESDGPSEPASLPAQPAADGGTPPVQLDSGGGSEPGADMPMGACTVAADCSVSNACLRMTCVSGRCVSTPVAEGTALPGAEQVAGDCQEILCDGHSGHSVRADPSDTPRAGANPCQRSACKAGKVERSPAPDGQACNGTGQCRAGDCSVCAEGRDCSQPGDCTVHETRCVGGLAQCVDTSRAAADGTACAAGKVCGAGTCVSCVVGAVCGAADSCKPSRIASCDNGPVCRSQSLNGGSCGADAAGNTKSCRDGTCAYDCKVGACSTANSCVAGQWDCGDRSAPPRCIANPEPEPDGTRCDTDSSCHLGRCVHAALVNGDMADGFRGWTLTGDAAKFIAGVDANFYGSRFVTTWIDNNGNGDVAKGVLSQTFTVPSDALALRFLVSGGHAHVRLRAEDGSILEDVTGPDSNDIHVPVNWELSVRRGQRVTLALEDELDAPGWSFVATLGFDVIRDVQTGLRNPQFDSGFASWTITGDAPLFNLFIDGNYAVNMDGNEVVQPAYGARASISTFVFGSNAAVAGDAAVGTVSQAFVVPPDALSLRFQVHGGKAGHIYLREGATVLYVVNANDTNMPKLPVSWDLVPFRGRSVTLSIEDSTNSPPWGFIGSSGFDLITTYNGP